MNFDTTINSTDYLMQVNNLCCGLNAPDACISKHDSNGKELAHSLPKYRPRKAYLVDAYPGCPKEWLRSTGRIKSYFVAVPANSGIWLDFNACLSKVQQHTAILCSVQGINALTGMKVNSPALEKYQDNCPKHSIPFSADRLCTKCNFRWPAQNFISSAATPEGGLWLDGYRCADTGLIRQYVVTSDKKRGVAKHLIGEARAFAFGISFFLSKTMRPAPPTPQVRGYSGLVTQQWKPYSGYSGFMSHEYPDNISFNDNDDDSVDMVKYVNDIKMQRKDAVGNITSHRLINNNVTYGCNVNSQMKSLGAPSEETAQKIGRRVTSNYTAPVQVENVEIAAGARIDQRIYDDPNGLDFWCDEPAGILVINYVLESCVEQIIAAGKIDAAGSPDGFLQNIPVGNP